MGKINGLGIIVNACYATVLQLHHPPTRYCLLITVIGSELKSWLLYYSLPVLNDILPQTFLVHYGLLVRSVHILASDSIAPEDLDQAENWLNEFYRQYKDLYGR